MLTKVALALAWIGTATAAAAQTIPSEPITFGGGRVVLGGDAAASLAPEDLGFFNYGDYEHSTLREIRVGMSARVRANRRISVLAEVRSQNFEDVSAFALYARLSPWPDRRVDIQVGRIPPTFGRFSRQAYSRENFLIGYPLAYQYLTSLRADALPANADELLQMRARGWRSNYSVGNLAPGPGVPLVSSLRWDTGVQMTAGWKALTVTGAVTSGTPSNPRVRDDNGGKQIATRVSVTPFTGLDIGASFARGEFVSRAAARAAEVQSDSDLAQIAAGVDVEYAKRRWLVRAEVVSSRWDVPFSAANTVERLGAVAVSVEGKVTLMPGLYAAVRGEHLGFDRIAGTAATLPWEAPVTRFEIGGGYYLQRNLIARSSIQINRRDMGRVSEANLVAVQLLYWF